MKNTYVKPEMQVEEFLANQYVAACGDTEYGNYKFLCNAGGGTYGAIFLKNSDGSYTRLSSSKDSFHACGESHETPVKDHYYEGLFDVDSNHSNGNESPCLIWYKEDTKNEWVWENGKRVKKTVGLGTYSYSGHATSNMSRDSWTTVKS
ncbi:MAG: hypothetical protein MJZ83_01595 [Bacteroidaceae bacterium]|nr:hypothetical protein [Bacteroidaceae bacterium]